MYRRISILIDGSIVMIDKRSSLEDNRHVSVPSPSNDADFVSMHKR